MKIQYICSLFLLISLSSCSKIISNLYGIREPKIEKDITIFRYLKSKSMEESNIYKCKGKEEYKNVFNYFNNNFPEALIFDKNGNQLLYKLDKQDCNAGLFNVIPNLEKNNNLKFGKLKINDFKSKITPFNKSSKLFLNEKTDYYLFINWAVFIGNLNVDHVKKWEKLAISNIKCKITVIKINMDLQEGWD
jgi:hypothetical protein